MKRPYRLRTLTLSAGVLVSAAACSFHGGGVGSVNARVPVSPASTASPASPVSPVSPVSPTVQESPTASATPSLTDAQASAALITETELGGRWAATQGGATWRDGRLKARTDVPDCQRLLDGLYAEDLLGEPKGPRAVVGLDESDNEAQLRYQVAAYAAPEDVDAKLAWLRTLPAKCAQFTATDARGGRQNVTVVPAVLPGVGDAREGLRMTMSSEPDVVAGDAGDDDDGSDGGAQASTLTLDFAAVRVGDRAVSLTNGGLGGAAEDSTQQAVRLGTQRLQDVLAGRRPTDPPTESHAESPTATEQG